MSKTKYQVGDVVRVIGASGMENKRSFRMRNNISSTNSMTPSMRGMADRTIIIRKITSFGQYKVEGDIYNNSWTDEMFCEVNHRKGRVAW